MGLQAYLDYWGRAIRKAWDGTCSSFKIKREDLLRNFIIFVIALLLLPKYGGAKEVIGELRWALVIIQAGIGTFALTFLVNLFRAPALIDKELEIEINNLQTQLGELREPVFPNISVEPQEPFFIFDTQKYPHLPKDGIHFIITSLKIFNRSEQNASIEFKLRVMAGETYETTLDVDRDIFPGFENRKQLPSPINIDPKKGVEGYISFFIHRGSIKIIQDYVPEASAEYFSKCELSLEVHDKLSGTEKILKAKRKGLMLSHQQPTPDMENSQNQ